MSNWSEDVFTRFRLGDPGDPTISGIYNENHDYVFPGEFERPSPRKNDQRRVVVRLRSIQVFNRDVTHISALARWIAERRLLESYVKDELRKLPAQFTASDQECEEFFRDVDPEKVAQHRDRWIELIPPLSTQKKIGF